MSKIQQISVIAGLKDPEAEESIVKALISEGMEVDTITSGKEIINALAVKNYDAILLGWEFDDGMSALEVLSGSRNVKSDLPIIMLSQYVKLSYASRAQALGAFDIIETPLSAERIIKIVNSALYRESFHDPTYQAIRSRFIGNDPTILGVIVEIARITREAACDVLLLGETGTGKDVVAHCIHELSERKDQPFICENCAAIPKDLAESTLFGHEKGAFTGAIQTVRGAFERTSNGTLFLDEISELPMDLQAKLLRVIEAREYRRIGGEELLRFDGRIIYASNRNLAEEANTGKFRKDLYHRITTHQIQLPSLRDRKKDISLLVEHFLHSQGKEKSVWLSRGAAALLEEYSYPGNVRELEGFIKHALLQCNEGEIQIRHLPLSKMDMPKETGEQADTADITLFSLPFDQAIARIEADYCRQYLPWLLKECGNNLTRAAKMANIDTKTFRNKWEKCGLGVLTTR